MKKFITSTILVILVVYNTLGQRVVFDQKHFQTIHENGAVRSAAELTHNQYLEKIDNNIQTININTGSIVLAQTIIYNGLANVNSALKNGLAVRDMSLIISEILQYSSQMLNMARSDPYLLLFAEDIAKEMKIRSVRLVNDVSNVVLNSNVLTDYNNRDLLLRNITQELRIICGLVYGAWKAMYWVKQKGIFKSVNPFADFINTDKQFVEEIIRNAKYLKQ